MADFNKPTVADIAAANPGVDAGTTGSMRIIDWGPQDQYWRDNYASRPYTLADRGYEYYQPAYKYGHESAFFYGGRPWDQEVEDDLARGWEQARGDSNCTWAESRDAVRDGYERTQIVGAAPERGA